MKGGNVAANVGQLSTDELREIIGSVVEQKLKEILGDPDVGLEVRADVRNRLLRQKKEDFEMQVSPE
jgi:hypothetical protein